MIIIIRGVRRILLRGGGGGSVSKLEFQAVATKNNKKKVARGWGSDNFSFLKHVYHFSLYGVRGYPQSYMTELSDKQACNRTTHSMFFMEPKGGGRGGAVEPYSPRPLRTCLIISSVYITSSKACHLVSMYLCSSGSTKEEHLQL